VALAETPHAMRIDSQHPGLEIARGAPEFAQGDLQALTVEHGSSPEEIVDGAVAGEERQAIGQREDLLVHGVAVPHAGGAESRFVDQLQRQTRLNTIGALCGPRADQIPGTQPQHFGGKQPDASQVAHDLVSEQLAHAAFAAPWVTGDSRRPPLGGLRLQRLLGIRAVAIEFFFEGHTSPRRVPHFGC